MVPLRTVTLVCPPVRTPTLSSCGFGQVCGPIPGPVRVWPPRSSTTLSTWMTNASPVHLRSFASTKSPVICVLHLASRGAMVSDGAGLVARLAGAGVVEGDAGAACDPLAGGGRSGGDSVDWHAAAMRSTAKPTALGRI